MNTTIDGVMVGTIGHFAPLNFGPATATMPWVLRDGQVVIGKDLGLFDLEQPGYLPARDLTFNQVRDELARRNAGVPGLDQPQQEQTR